MNKIFEVFLRALLGPILEWIQGYIELMNGIFRGLVVAAMQIERLSEAVAGIRNPVTAEAISQAYNYIYGTMVLLLVVFFLYKGFKVYILWRDGDAEVSPQTMVLGAISALVMALAFPFLYSILCQVIITAGNRLSDIFQASTISFLEEPDITALLERINLAGLIMGVVFIFMAWVMVCKMVARGVELLFLRIGFPIACLGLINSDGGMFKQYVGVFLRVAALTVIQMVCFLLALCCVTGITVGDMILGFAFMMTAFSAPKLMAQFMPNAGGGGIGSAAGALTTIIRTAAMAAV